MKHIQKLRKLILALGIFVGMSMTAYAVDTDLTMDDLVRAIGNENLSWLSADWQTTHSIYVYNGVVEFMFFQEGSSGEIYNAESLTYNSSEGKYFITFAGWTPTYYLVLNNANYITSFVKSDDESHALTGTSENPFEKPVTNYTVTYKVVNGTWDDTSTADKTETVANGGNPASVPTGMVANSGYTGGSWDTDPSTATISADTTFTYTFVAPSHITITAKADLYNTGTYYATFYDSTKSYVADCEVYYATANAGGRFTLEKAEGKVIKAGEGVILKATSETVTLTQTDAAASYDSLLTGSDTETSVENALVLSLGKNGVWFYKYSGTLGANKAYLAQ